MLAAFLANQFPPSSVVHTKTWGTSESARGVAIIGSRMLVQNSSIFCIDLKGQKQVWKYSVATHPYAQNLAVVGTKVFGAFSSADSKDRTSTIAEIDLTKGSTIKSMLWESQDSSLTSDGFTLYCLDKDARVVALNAKTMKTIWRSEPLAKKRKSYAELEGLARIGEAIVFNYDSTVFCLSSSTGRRKWTESESFFSGAGTYVAAGDRVLLPKNGLLCKSVSSGKKLWSKPGNAYSETTIARGDRFILGDNGVVRCLRASNGEQVWKSKGTPNEYERSGERGFSQNSGIFRDMFIQESETEQLVLTLDGKEVSRTPLTKAINIPIWQSGTSLATFDRNRIRWYTPGEPIGPPSATAARVAMANRLAAGYPNLDRHDYSVLKGLTPENFAPMLDRYVQLSREEVAQGEYYADARELGKDLYRLSTRQSADLVVEKLKATKKDEDCRVILLSILAKVGDPDKVVPFFLDALNQKTPGFELYESETFVAREYISQSTHPSAVKYFVDLLRNPNADETQREAAYVTLAGKSEEATEEVRKQKRSRTLLRPMIDRFELDDLGKSTRDRKTTLLLKTQTVNGTEWGLMSSSILGNYSDLFIARKNGGKWQRPVFLGVSGEPVSRWVKPTPPEPTVLGLTGKSLLTGKWIELIPSAEKFATDSDGDGYRDLEEARLGTDPKSADMDGDGDRDELDPFPNVARRPKTEDELALAAAYEARYHFFENSGPALLSVPSTQDAFEMTGWGGPVIVRAVKQERDWSHPLDRCYEYGVGMIGLSSSDNKTGSWISNTLVWDAKHEVATVNISTYYGGLNGTGYVVQVRKFGSDWLVISSRMAYVS